MDVDLRIPTTPGRKSLSGRRSSAGGRTRRRLLATFSLVVKPVAANDRPLVKLSDDAATSTGDPAEVARYRRIFDCPAVAGPAPRY